MRTVLTDVSAFRLLFMISSGESFSTPEGAFFPAEEPSPDGVLQSAGGVALSPAPGS
ncbi:hypothetical protein ACFYM7_30440 [Streptomyces cyaneofuscatus]|uniref:hypothetical protein n=1 Tax=Streptomyces cyaneofuscatus TaxID=66883 RepID=UPI0036D149E1